jgi:hypothetical protein
MIGEVTRRLSAKFCAASCPARIKSGQALVPDIYDRNSNA